MPILAAALGRPPRRAILAVLIAGAWFVALGAVAAAPGHEPGRSPLEDQVKAAFLYNFAKFVEWPPEAFPDAGSPLRIGVLGNPGFAGTLQTTVHGKTVQGRPLTVHRADGVEDLANPHVLFVTAEAAGSLSNLLEATRGSPVLIVSESANQARRGAIINFYLEDNRVRFEINIAAAERARLTISSKLLNLARIVETGTGQGR